MAGHGRPRKTPGKADPRHIPWQPPFNGLAQGDKLPWQQLPRRAGGWRAYPHPLAPQCTDPARRAP